MIDNSRGPSQRRPTGPASHRYIRKQRWQTNQRPSPPRMTAPEPFWRDFLPADFNLPRLLLSMLALAGMLRLSEEHLIAVLVACTVAILVALSIPDRPVQNRSGREDDHA